MDKLGSNISKAALKAGLPASSLGEFVPAVIAQNHTAVGLVSGVNGTIIEAGVHAVLTTYLKAFHHVWLTAIPFIGVALIGRPTPTRPLAVC